MISLACRAAVAAAVLALAAAGCGGSGSPGAAPASRASSTAVAVDPTAACLELHNWQLHNQGQGIPPSLGRQLEAPSGSRIWPPRFRPARRRCRTPARLSRTRRRSAPTARRSASGTPCRPAARYEHSAGREAGHACRRRCRPHGLRRHRCQGPGHASDPRRSVAARAVHLHHLRPAARCADHRQPGGSEPVR